MNNVGGPNSVNLADIMRARQAGAINPSITRETQQANRLDSPPNPTRTPVEKSPQDVRKNIHANNNKAAVAQNVKSALSPDIGGFRIFTGALLKGIGVVLSLPALIGGTIMSYVFASRSSSSEYNLGFRIGYVFSMILTAGLPMLFIKLGTLFSGDKPENADIYNKFVKDWFFQKPPVKEISYKDHPDFEELVRTKPINGSKVYEVAKESAENGSVASYFNSLNGILSPQQLFEIAYAVAQNNPTEISSYSNIFKETLGTENFNEIAQIAEKFSKL